VNITREVLRKALIDKIKTLSLPIKFDICEADADYGYKVNKDLSVEAIGEYSKEDVQTLEDLTTIDLMYLVFFNDNEYKKERDEV